MSTRALEPDISLRKQAGPFKRGIGGTRAGGPTDRLKAARKPVFKPS
jgi:hypothetical protein